MAKLTNVDGVGKDVEFGRNGLRVKADSGIFELVNAVGDLAEVRGKAGSHANSLVTKDQLEAATGQDMGTVWLEFTTEPEITSLTANTWHQFDLATGTAADLMADHSTIPSNTSWNGSDARTYIIDTTNNLITPNQVSKQPHVISVHLSYSGVGGSTDNDAEMKVKLVEYDGSSEKANPANIKTFRKAYNDSGAGEVTFDFSTVASSHTIGSGKGWRLYFMSNESDGTVSIKVKCLRMRAG